MRRKTRVLLLLTVFLPLLGITDERTPPSSAAIHQTLERLWGERKYGELAEYIHDLQNKWSTYVPVELTMAIYSYQYGAQVEDAIERLNRLREKLKSDIAGVSPLFMEFLDSRITRYKSIRQFYLERGISCEQRLAERNPLKETTFKHSKRWVGVDEMLYFNTPDVFLDESGVRTTRKQCATTLDPSFVQMPSKVLLSKIGDANQPMIQRKACAKELVRRRFAGGGVSNLVQSLRAGDISYTYHDTVDELVKAGSSAIPFLVEFINDPAHLPYDQKMAIWVLVRIGVADTDVIQTLQSVSSTTDHADLAKYAHDALQYLQSKNR